MKNRTSKRLILPTRHATAILAAAMLLGFQPAARASLLVSQTPSDTYPLESDQVRPLEPDGRIERAITGGQQHTYGIGLQAGQFIRVLVEQKDIDVALVLIAPGGKQVVEVNFTREGGPESLSEEVAANGAYRLTVRGAGSATSAGDYRARLEVRAAASAQDRLRIVAERLLVEAAQLRRKGPEAAQQCIEKSDQALVVWRGLGDQVWEAYTLRTIAAVYRSMSRYEKAIEYYDQSLPLARAVNDRYGEADALHNLAIPYGLMGRHEKSVEYSEQALVIWRELKIRSRISPVLNNLGLGYKYLGRYDKAIEYQEQALAIKREAKDRSGEGVSVSNLGTIYQELGDYQKAIEYQGQALLIFREVKDQASEAAVLSNLGNSNHRLRRFEKAIEYREQALAASRKVRDRAVEGRTLAGLGSAYSSLGKYDKAIEYHQQALAILRELKLRGEEGATLNYLGNIYHSMGRYDKAIEYFEQGLSIARETKERDSEASSLFAIATAERERGNLSHARNLVEQSLKIAESFRSNIYNQDLRASYFASTQNYNGFYIDLLMRLHKANPSGGFDALAVEASEGARARGLLQLLTEAGAQIRQGVDATLLERERTLATELNAGAANQVQLLSRPYTSEQMSAIAAKISQTENDYAQVQAQIRRTSPRYAALTQPQPLGLKEIQQQLDQETLLLEYSLGEERSYLWVIGHNSIASYELPKQEQIKTAAANVGNLLTARSHRVKGETAQQRQMRIRRSDEQLPAAAQQISQMLLGPFAAQLANKRLIIVADGPLQYLPFAMLPEPATGRQGEGERGRRGDGSPRHVAPSPRLPLAFTPLIVKHEIISLPSASTLAVQRRELAGRKPAPNLLAVLADPVFSTTDERVKAIGFKASAAQPDFQGSSSAATSDTTRIIEHLGEESAAGTTRTLTIPRLPYTRREADQIIAVAAGSKTLKATDYKANRATVTSGELSRYRYVHFATHGVLDSERPGLSALVLSMVDEQGNPQDGFLRANDIYNLKLPAELVVLSACQTGLGKEIKGEGLVGLTRGFMYAGAARVVVSLWNVNDKATADLMTKFYEKMLKQGERPAAALRAAQVEMWKQKQWQSPYYWAAFVMQGEWR